jgi:hypothetical protein
MPSVFSLSHPNIEDNEHLFDQGKDEVTMGGGEGGGGGGGKTKKK